MKRTISTILRIFLPFLLGAGILYWMYRGSSWSDISDMLFNRMEWSWMAVSLLFGILPQILRGWRWRIALEPAGEKPRRSTCAWAIFVSYAASLVIPRVGEITRCGTLKRYEGTSFAKSLGTVVTERIVDALFMLIVTLLTLVTQRRIFATFFDRTGTNFESLFSKFTITESVVTVLCVAATVAFVVMLVKKLKVFGFVRSTFHDLWEGIISMRRMKSFPLYLLYSFAIWFCYYLHFSFTLLCFDFTESLGASEALVIFCAGSYAHSNAQRCRSVALCGKDNAYTLRSGSRRRDTLRLSGARNADRAYHRAWNGWSYRVTVYEKADRQNLRADARRVKARGGAYN